MAFKDYDRNPTLLDLKSDRSFMERTYRPPKVYADKGYCRRNNCDCLTLNEIDDSIMRKD